MKIRYLNDRHIKADLEATLPEVARSLRKRWSVMMESGRETVAWVGIAQAGQSGTYFFLPHGSPSQPDDRERFASILMQAIVRFSRENARYGEGRAFASSTFAALLADLAADYRDHGLFATREKLRSRQDGKPDWARTVKTQTAFPSSTGAPVYCEISSLRYSSRSTNIIARIQAHVIAEIHQQHGWWLAAYFGSRDLPLASPGTEWPREHWPSLLRAARRDLYRHRAIHLVGLLLDYLEMKSESGQGDVPCGISDFSTMWEVMLRETIAGVERGWNDWLPRPSYVRPDGTGIAISGMELDIVVRENDYTVILDAKYYLATSKGYLPGTPDISKQLIYQRAVESTGKVSPDKLINAFVFPAEKTGRKPFDTICFFLPDGTATPHFPPVLCQYVSVSDVVTAYAARRKLVDQSWLSELREALQSNDLTAENKLQNYKKHFKISPPIVDIWEY